MLRKMFGELKMISKGSSMDSKKGYILQDDKDLWLVIENKNKSITTNWEHLKDFIDDDNVAYPVIHENIEAIFYACKAYLENIN